MKNTTVATCLAIPVGCVLVCATICYRTVRAIEGRVQACEICHFGGDAETVQGRLKTLERRPHEDLQPYVDAAISDLVIPVQRQVDDHEKALRRISPQDFVTHK